MGAITSSRKSEALVLNILSTVLRSLNGISSEYCQVDANFLTKTASHQLTADTKPLERIRNKKITLERRLI